RPRTRNVVVLHGLGGIGKSSIALEYSFRYSESYTTVFWVDVTSGTSLSRSARGFLDPNGRLTSDEAAEHRVTGAVKEWLATRHNEAWLLVLNNYDHVDAIDIHRILPTCDHGNVIITSRKSNLQALGKTVPVDEINEQSGVMLLLKSAN
ncbi:hypothetical protein K440DRAFT_483683, partial [Wilcoxina mikolae CBS 423.85]